MTRKEAVKWLERIEERYILCGDEGFDKARKEALHMAIEALERPHGEWIVDDEYIDCSCCRHEKWSRMPYEQLVSKFRFCPNCGADMRGNKDDKE